MLSRSATHPHARQAVRIFHLPGLASGLDSISVLKNFARLLRGPASGNPFWVARISMLRCVVFEQSKNPLRTRRENLSRPLFSKSLIGKRI